MRKFIFLLVALIGGPAMIVSGFRDYQNSKKLAATGKVTSAVVVDAIETVSRKYRTHRYYLVVKYQPEGAQAYTKKLSVSHDVFDQGIAARSVQVHYLPSDPNVAQLGEICFAGQQVDVLGRPRCSMNRERDAAADRVVDRRRVERGGQGDDLGEQIHGAMIATRQAGRR